MHIIMVPGLWLDGASWELVTPALEQAGHRTHAVTLPGMESRGADRSAVTVRDLVDAIVGTIDSVDPATGKVALVGHSLGCNLAWAAADARSGRVACTILIGGFPAIDGQAPAAGFATENGDIPFPDWTTFGDEDLADMNEEARAAFRDQALPSPASLASDPQRLSDDRRYDIPVVAVATEYTSDMLKAWIDAGEESVQEFAKIRTVKYIDLPTGHWPQFTRPVDLAQVILAAIDTTTNGHDETGGEA